MKIYAHKSARLFFQAAQRVNTLDSRVLFSDAGVNTRARLDMLMEGSVRENIPEKWFTAMLKEQLYASSVQWEALKDVLSPWEPVEERQLRLQRQRLCKCSQ